MAQDQNPERADGTPPYVVGVEGGDNSGVDVIGLVIGAIAFLKGLFGGRVDAAVKRALEGLRDGLERVGKAIADGVAWLSHKIIAAIEAVKRFIVRTFGPLYDMLKRFVQRVQRILDRVIGPIIDFLDKVREHVMAIYNDIVKPILDIIEFIRIPLRILSQFNVEWAKRLDATLAGIEDDIAHTFSYVLGQLNKTINLLNDIVDVDRLLKRFTFIRTVMRDVRYINQVVLMSRFRRESFGEFDARKKRLNEMTLREVRRNTELVILTGDGPYGSFVREMSAQWRIELRDAGF